MPNWATGTVILIGKEKENIEQMLNYFTENTEDITERITKGDKFFARTLLHSDKETIINDIEYVQELGYVSIFECDFAWSVYSCLIEGYPQESDLNPTLIEVCMECRVSAEISAWESGVGFEESIECDEEGDLTVECFDLDYWRCKECGELSVFPSWIEPNRDMEPCWECEGTDWIISYKWE